MILMLRITLRWDDVDDDGDISDKKWKSSSKETSNVLDLEDDEA